MDYHSVNFVAWKCDKHKELHYSIEQQVLVVIRLLMNYKIFKQWMKQPIT